MRREFDFCNKPEELYPLLSKILISIDLCIGHFNTNNVKSKCNLILIELLTNAIKHAGKFHSRIRIIRETNSLHIIKLDEGNRYQPSPSNIFRLPFDETQIGKKLVLASDHMTELYVIAETEYKLKFNVQDKTVGHDIRISDLLEHFGMVIITKASDHFEYEYQPQRKLNVFKAIIHLQNI